MSDDIYCKIIRGEYEAEFLYRDDDVMVIRDINPHAPVHLLIIPLHHYESIGEVTEKDGHILGSLMRVAHRVALEQGLTKGYRLIMNEGADSGKQIPHIHLHLLGGKKLGPKLVG